MKATAELKDADGMEVKIRAAPATVEGKESSNVQFPEVSSPPRSKLAKDHL